MGWLILLGLAALAVAALWRFGGLDPSLRLAVAAALTLAAAGYAWQGSPGRLGAAPESARARVAGTADRAFTVERRILFGNFSTAEPWLITADAYLRIGQTEAATSLLRSAIRQNPRDPVLWLGLADALTAHAQGLVTPAARLAFARAQQLDPSSPAPRWFLGLALVGAGDVPGARREWEALLADAPRDTSWRPTLERRLGLLGRLERAAPPIAP